MTLHVDVLEAIWVLENAATIVFLFAALIDARRSLVIAQLDTTISHEARELTVWGSVRRAFLGLVIAALLLAVAIPGLFVDRPIALSPQLIALMLVPAVLLLQALLDTRDRARLVGLLLDVVKAERDGLAKESSVQSAIEQAKAAYHEANDVNRKIASLTEALGHKEDKPVADGVE